MLTWLKPKTGNAQVQDLWAVEVKGGAPYVLVDADQLSSASKALSEAEKARRERMRVSARGVVAYDWDASSKSILVPLDGDIYRVDLASRKITQITDTPDDEVDAKLSPTGRHLTYVRKNTLYVKELESGSEVALTPNGDGAVSYGVAEFIAQEELGRYTGYWWSPDSTRIAYARVDESQVDIVPRIEIGGSEFRLIEQRYPKAGTKNAVVELYVKALSGEAVKVDLGSNSDIYLARVNWSVDGKTLYVQRLSRDQQRLDLLKVDPATGAASVLLSEVSDSWIDLNNDFKPLKDGRFLWVSEADGNNHIYLYGADGKLIQQVTRGDWPVDYIAAVNEATGDI
ncbi:MAG: peptidase S9, partial [Asticcacaulis sp. 32-58-5]